MARWGAHPACLHAHCCWSSFLQLSPVGIPVGSTSQCDIPSSPKLTVREPRSPSADLWEGQGDGFDLVNVSAAPNHMIPEAGPLVETDGDPATETKPRGS